MDAPLDDAFDAWAEAVRPRLDEALRETAQSRPLAQPPRLRLVLNDRAHAIRKDGSKVDPGLLEGPDLEALLGALRARMAPVVWPLGLDVEIEGLTRRGAWRISPVLSGASLAGIEIDERRHGLLFRERGWGGKLEGLDRIAEAGDLLERLCPPSNGPVRAWSSVSRMMGTVHVSHQSVHARSEPEALLKMLLGQRGIDRFSAMAESGRIEPLGGPFPTWFTATDIEDLDLDPEGRVVRQEDALDMLNAHLERERADDADPSP